VIHCDGHLHSLCLLENTQSIRMFVVRIEPYPSTLFVIFYALGVLPQFYTKFDADCSILMLLRTQ
jgi:hypothetical protein